MPKIKHNASSKKIKTSGGNVGSGIVIVRYLKSGVGE